MKTRILIMVFAVVLTLFTNATTAFADTNVKQENMGGSGNAITDETILTSSKDTDIPDEYREFVRKGGDYYHSLTIHTNYEVKIGEILKKTKTPTNGTPFEAYYVYAGDYTLKLATPDGRILTAEELDEYFLGILPPKTAYEPMEWESEMVRLVNIEREKAGVAPVEANTKLMEIAALKAKEMMELDYSSHASPNYGSPSEFARHYGYGKNVGENIHGGFVKDISPQAVLNAWLNSEGHKKNLLNPNWKYIGMGWNSREYTRDNGLPSSKAYWFVQLFSR